ncbi:MAG: DUF3667 domain-containing protein [Pseudomonadota bacterium]
MAFFDSDSGFVATLLALFKNPGRLVSRYVSGVTVPYVHPARYLIVTIAALQLTIGLTGGISDFAAGFVEATGDLENLSQAQQDSNDLFQNYLFVVMLLGLPLRAAFQRLVFWSSGRNFVEHFVCMTYVYAQQLVIINLLLVTDALLPTPPVQLLSLLFFVLPSVYYAWTLVVFNASRLLTGTIQALLMLLISAFVNAVVVAFVLGIIRGMRNAAGT